MTNNLNSPEAETTNVSLGHSYDGIQEYDNPLPSWWKNLFWVTIMLTPCYLAYFHTGGPNRTIVEKYVADLSANTRKQYVEIGDLASDEATLLQYLNQPKWVGVGQAIFKANCISCHGANGGGGVGPNLCDENFKHIKQIADILTVIDKGVAGGAMPAWGNRFSHRNDAVLVAVYVASLRGTSPANPKAPDGNPIPPWPKK